MLPAPLRAAACLVAALLVLGQGAYARQTSEQGLLGDISASELPHEARETLELIRKGGPFPFRKDGTLFGNREGRLPYRSRGYYTEYTVRTPGSHDRGARRIIVGRGRGKPAASGEYYYTEDHYNTFRRIRE